jgi:hypothetical protein
MIAALIIAIAAGKTASKIAKLKDCRVDTPNDGP